MFNSMRTIFVFLLFSQSMITVLAVLLNILLVVVICYTPAKIGAYKHLMKAFAVFEAIYAIVVFVGMPMHYVADRTWIEFTHFGLLASLGIPTLGPVLYCLFYQYWLAFTVVHFIFRYVSICNRQWILVIEQSSSIKASIISFGCFFAILGCVCASVLCTQNIASQKLLKGMQDMFEITDTQNIGYYIIRLTKLDGSISPTGVLTFIMHYIGVYGSVFIVGFCSYKIWQKLRALSKCHSEVGKLFIEIQLFKTLILQTLVPVVLCHIPSMLVLTFPIWESDLISFGSVSTMFPIFLTLTKMIDPIIPIICVSAYRKTFLRLIRCRSPNMVEASSVGSYPFSSSIGLPPGYTSTGAQPPTSVNPS